MQNDIQEQRKLFEGLAAAYILGAEQNLERDFQKRFSGDAKISAVCLKALKASKALYESLKDEATSEQEVMNSIEAKRIAAKEFKAHMKYPWPF
jgi:anti-sigma-K factor RskA